MKKIFSVFAAVLCAAGMMAQTDLVTNGNFADGLNGWTVKYQQAADSAVYAISAAQGDFSLSQPTAATGRVDLYQDITIVPGTAYTLSFEYKETHAKFRNWSVFKTPSNVTFYLDDLDAKDDPLRTNNGYYEAAADWSAKSIEFTAPAADSITVFHLEFRYYKQTGNEAHLRNVSLIETQASAVDCVAAEQKAVKVIENGRVFIIKNGVRYNALGAKL